MSVDTKQAVGRRKLHFSSYQDILDDVHALAGGPVRQLGNWSLGGICEHLSKAMDYGIDGAPFAAPWYMRLVGPLLKHRVIARPMSPGFKLPANAGVYLPSTQADASGIAELERAIERMRTVAERKPHVILGQLSREQWDQLHFRHAEMHLSFIVPA